MRLAPGHLHKALAPKIYCRPVMLERIGETGCLPPDLHPSPIRHAPDQEAGGFQETL